MFDDMVNLFNLGAFSDEEKELLRTDFTYKKQMSRLLKEARQAAKRDTCYFCGKSVTSFCNSHSVPRFCLENIATNGDVLTLNTVVDNPLIDTENGVNKAGTWPFPCAAFYRIFFDEHNTQKLPEASRLSGSFCDQTAFEADDTRRRRLDREALPLNLLFSVLSAVFSVSKAWQPALRNLCRGRTEKDPPTYPTHPVCPALPLLDNPPHGRRSGTGSHSGQCREITKKRRRVRCASFLPPRTAGRSHSDR